jgi:hypothetical protein
VIFVELATFPDHSGNGFGLNQQCSLPSFRSSPTNTCNQVLKVLIITRGPRVHACVFLKQRQRKPQIGLVKKYVLSQFVPVYRIIILSSLLTSPRLPLLQPPSPPLKAVNSFTAGEHFPPGPRPRPPPPVSSVTNFVNRSEQHISLIKIPNGKKIPIHLLRLGKVPCKEYERYWKEREHVVFIDEYENTSSGEIYQWPENSDPAVQEEFFYYNFLVTFICQDWFKGTIT